MLPAATMLETRNYWLSKEEMALFSREKRYSFKSVFEHQKDKFIGLLHKSTDFGLKGAKSQDVYNRNKIPKSKVPDKSIPDLKSDPISEQAILYVEKHFGDNYGQVPERILFPVTSKASLKWLKGFFSAKLLNFGKY